MSKSTRAGVPLVLERTITIRWPLTLTKNIVIPYNGKREAQALANKIANLKAEGRYPSTPTDGRS